MFYRKQTVSGDKSPKKRKKSSWTPYEFSLFTLKSNCHFWRICKDPICHQARLVLFWILQVFLLGKFKGGILIIKTFSYKDTSSGIIGPH